MLTLKEEWKDVAGFEGLYQISNFGNLKSFLSKNDGYVLSEKNSKGWYLTTALKDSEGNFHTKRIHRLVAENFIGEIPKGYHVHHKDGNKQNNRVDNLEIIHPMKHARETINQNQNVLRGMNHYNRYERPKPVYQFSIEGDFIAKYANAEIASRYTGVCQRNILQVANGDKARKHAGGFIWSFSDKKEVIA